MNAECVIEILITRNHGINFAREQKKMYENHLKSIEQGLER